MSKDAVYQLSLFSGLLLFSLSLIWPTPLLVIAAFLVSLLALIRYRKQKPRVDHNFKKGQARKVIKSFRNQTISSDLPSLLIK